LRGRPIPEQLNEIISAFDSTAELATLKGPPPPEILVDFVAAIRSAIDPSAYTQLLNVWPSSFPHSPTHHTVLYFLASVISQTADHHSVLRFLAKHIPGLSWAIPPASFLKAFSVARFRRKKKGPLVDHWATLDNSNKLEFFRFGEDDLVPAGVSQLGELRDAKPGLRAVAVDGSSVGYRRLSRPRLFPFRTTFSSLTVLFRTAFTAASTILLLPTIRCCSALLCTFPWPGAGGGYDRAFASRHLFVRGER
jgi:hypothetical protein